MATFKVGQRVKVVSVEGAITQADLEALGKEGVIVALGPVRCGGILSSIDREYNVRLEGVSVTPNYGFDACHLAPLTDPKADAFIERIKNLKPYEEPTRNPYQPLTPRELSELGRISTRWLEGK
jgi:hypothetical protein